MCLSRKKADKFNFMESFASVMYLIISLVAGAGSLPGLEDLSRDTFYGSNGGSGEFSVLVSAFYIIFPSGVQISLLDTYHRYTWPSLSASLLQICSP